MTGEYSFLIFDLYSNQLFDSGHLIKTIDFISWNKFFNKIVFFVVRSQAEHTQEK